MNDRGLTIEEAIAQRSANPGAKWPERGSENRLEPECWPIIRPSFKFNRDAKVFAIGSCFARNIEVHLQSLGFRVPALDILADRSRNTLDLGGEIVVKYTPTSIHQELLWVKSIFDRDDVVRDDDVFPLLMDIGGGRYVDLHVTADGGSGWSFEQNLERRRFLYALAREAFLSDVVVITLGLIETWRDLQTGKTIELHQQFVRPALRASLRDRFAFRRLRFDEAYEATRKSVDLLLEEPRRKILITASPVPLTSTFTADDVIVANSYSKAMLRTVAGAIAEETERVDYFPSFESVMLTKRSEVWSNDLIHVQSYFVGQIMARVVEHYTEGGADTSTYQEMARFSEAVRSAQWELARPLYASLVRNLPTPATIAQELMLAEYEALNGVPEASLRRIRALDELNAANTKFSSSEYFWCGRLYRLNARESDTVRLYEAGGASIGSNMTKTSHLLGHFIFLKWSEEIEWLLDWAARVFSAEFVFLSHLASVWKNRGRLDKYHEVKKASFQCGAEPEAVRHYAGELELAGCSDKAIEILTDYSRRVRHPALLGKLAELLLAKDRIGEAEAVIQTWIDADETDAAAHGSLALVLSRIGRTEEAARAGRRALDLGCAKPTVLKLMAGLDATVGSARGPTC